MSDFKDKSLKDFENEFKQNKRLQRWSKIKNAINIFPQPTLKIPDAPDVSTLTEHIAFVLDDKVVEIMHCQPKLAAILLSEPQIIKIEDGKFAKPGWEYKNGNFVSPQGEQQQAEPEKDYLPTFKEYVENKDKPALPTFKEYVERMSKDEKASI